MQRLMEEAELRLDGGPATRVHVEVGALSNISPAALQRQFGKAAAGSRLEGAELIFHIGGDPLSPGALAVRVLSVERPS